MRGGVWWSIGSGASIFILNEPWLYNGEVISSEIPGAYFVRNFTINSLMNLYDKSWNKQVIRQVFSADIADKILHTPLIHQVEEDKIIWKAERHGRYSVHNAYRLCVTELVDSSYNWRSWYWSGIWKLKVPPKVKNLVWRMCCGCLPTRVRLLNKRVVCPTNFASCDSNNENLMHVFFDCPFAIQVWHKTRLWSSIQHAISTTTSTTDAIFSLLEQLFVDVSQRLTTIFLSIWKHRNFRVWDNATKTSVMVAERARNMVVDWQMLLLPLHQMGINSLHRHKRYKCNNDAAFSSHFNRTCISICIYDSDGTFVLAKTVTYPCIVSVDVGEALSLH